MNIEGLQVPGCESACKATIEELRGCIEELARRAGQRDDLLAALEGLVRVLDQTHEEPTDQEIQHALVEARAAIARAYGINP